MSHFSKAGLLISLAFFAGTVTFTQVSLADSTAAPGANHPCMQLRNQVISACQAQGFVKGQAKEGTGLYKDCVEPVIHGQTIKGVSADPNLLAACQAKKAAKKAAPAN
jgi:hypothetical protein